MDPQATPGQLVDRLRNRLGRLVRSGQPGDRFALLTFDPEDPAGAPPAVLGSPLGYSELGRALMRRVLASGAAAMVEDFSTDAELRTVAAELDVAAAAAFPVQARGRTVGVASFFLSKPASLQTASARNILQHLKDAAFSIADRLPTPPRATAARTRPIVQSPVPARPLVDLVAAVLGETVARLDAEADRADKMSEANRLKTEFISVVSHELRTPLSSVLGYSELLTSRDFSPERVRQIAAETHRESKRMLQLVDDLLDVSRAESGRYTIDPQPLRLAQELQQVVDNLSTTTSQHRLLADCPEDLVVSADPVRLWQVLQNLVANAVHYSPNGGTITIRAMAHGTGQEMAGQLQGMARVEVADEGIGIPHADRERIFDKFYRVDNELRRRVRGSGLGLAVCQTIVAAHGGRIWVESKVGRGSTFSFTLPLATPVPSEPHYARESS